MQYYLTPINQSIHPSHQRPFSCHARSAKEDQAPNPLTLLSPSKRQSIQPFIPHYVKAHAHAPASRAAQSRPPPKRLFSDHVPSLPVADFPSLPVADFPSLPVPDPSILEV